MQIYEKSQNQIPEEEEGLIIKKLSVTFAIEDLIFQNPKVKGTQFQNSQRIYNFTLPDKREDYNISIIVPSGDENKNVTIAVSDQDNLKITEESFPLMGEWHLSGNGIYFVIEKEIQNIEELQRENIETTILQFLQKKDFSISDQEVFQKKLFSFVQIADSPRIYPDTQTVVIQPGVLYASNTNTPEECALACYTAMAKAGLYPKEMEETYKRLKKDLKQTKSKQTVR